MSASRSRIHLSIVIAAFFATAAAAQTLVLEKTGPAAGNQFGTSVAFGAIDDPNGPNPLRVIAVGQPFASPQPNVQVFDAAGNLVLQSPSTALINEYGFSVAFGKLAPALTPDDILICGGPGTSIYSNAGVVVLNTPTPSLPAIIGSQASERFGHSVAVIGDVTGNAIDDFMIGAPNYDSGAMVDAGRVVIRNGGSPYALIREHVGFQQGGRFGWSVAGIGDIDADGVSDYIIGMPDYDNTAANPNVGRAHLYSGASGSLIRSHLGVNDNEQYGYSVAGCGDMNADGRPDYAVGAPETTLFPGYGRVEVRSGLDGSVIYAHGGAVASSTYGHLGASLAGGHDVDRDGVPDLVAGLPGVTTGGIVQVYSGRTGALLHDVRGSQTGEAFGHAVALGQLNEDAYSEFAIGRPTYNGLNGFDEGAVSVFTGAIHFRFEWPVTGDVKSVDVAGDVNGDGFDDLIVGASVVGNLDRAWRVLDGRTSQVLRQDPVAGLDMVDSVSGLVDVSGDGRDDFIIGRGSANLVEVRGGPFGNVLGNLSFTGLGNFGHAVDDAGDLDGDGVHDIIVGAPYWGTTSLNGFVTIHSGATGAVLASHAGIWPGGNLGFSVAGAGDVDGDGVNDYIEGSPKVQPGPGESGLVGIRSGASNVYIASIFGAAGQSSHCGWSVDGLGDVNADGYDDVIVGEPHYNGTGGVSCGRARVFGGGPGGMVLLHTIEGQYFELCGHSVARVGDVDRDGWNDFAVGFLGADLNPNDQAGAVRVYSGQTGSLLLERFGAPNDFLGYSIGGASAGADARNELAVSAFPFGGAPSYAVLLQMPEAKTATIGPAGCAGGPILLTGTGSCAGMLSGCSVPLGDPVTAAGLPILGEQLVLTIAGAPPNGLFHPFASIGPDVVTPIGGGCLVYLNLATLITTLPPIPTDPAGSATIGFFLPSDPGLLGISGVLQGVVFPTGGGLQLSNAIRTTIGFANHGL